MADLDSMLADEGDESFDDDLGLEVDVDEDPFTMHAETFLDDSMSMPERVEALRAAILAAGAPPAEEDDLGVDF
jgi:hypothetical protein